MAEANQKPPEAGGAEQAEQPQPSTEVSKDARMWAMLCHLLGLFTCFIGPLIIWLIKKEEDPFIDNQGKEALNFQITVAIAGIVSALLAAVCIGVFLGIAVSIADLVFCIIASIKANSGEAYRYPVSIRFIK
jgi:uncharacterized Tic20 family protein